MAADEDVDSVILESSPKEKSRTFEETMITYDGYRQAMFNEMGVLYFQIALDLMQKEPEKSEKFINQSLDFIEKKLPFTTEKESKSFKILKTVFELGKGKKYDKIDFKQGRGEIAALCGSMEAKQKLKTARDGYYKIFKHY